MAVFRDSARDSLISPPGENNPIGLWGRSGRRWRLTGAPRFILRHLWAASASAVARFIPTIRSVTPGADRNAESRRAAIYVSFDPGSVLADYVVAQVAALAACGRRVVFISTSPTLHAADIARLHDHVREVVHRRNLGHDFGAYKDGIARLGDVAAVDSLVLMNDSCYTPAGDLQRVEAAAAASATDLFGITDSWSLRYHLQTYYLWVGGAALRSPAFAAFWRDLRPSQPRSLVITNGEIRLTQSLLAAGFTVRALCPYTDVARRALASAQRRLAANPAPPDCERRYLAALARDIVARKPLNPTHSFWDVLLSECGSPFVKRELLARNPLQIPDVADWERIIGALPGAGLDVMRAHLHRSRAAPDRG